MRIQCFSYCFISKAKQKNEVQSCEVVCLTANDSQSTLSVWFLIFGHSRPRLIFVSEDRVASSYQQHQCHQFHTWYANSLCVYVYDRGLRPAWLSICDPSIVQRKAVASYAPSLTFSVLGSFVSCSFEFSASRSYRDFILSSHCRIGHVCYSVTTQGQFEPETVLGCVLAA